MFTAADEKYNNAIQEFVSRILGAEKVGGDKFSAVAVIEGTKDNPGAMVGGVQWQNSHCAGVRLAAGAE